MSVSVRELLRKKDLQTKIQRGCGGEKGRLETETDSKSEIGKEFWREGPKQKMAESETERQGGPGGRKAREGQRRQDRQTERLEGWREKDLGLGAGWRGRREGGS